MPNWEGLNRREFPRVNYPCLVVIQPNKGGKDDIILSHTENVGVGGVCVILKKDIKIFSEVNVELDLLDLEKHIKCKGRVVWNVRRNQGESRKPQFYDIGIEFQDIEPPAQDRLNVIVGRLEKSRKVFPPE